MEEIILYKKPVEMPVKLNVWCAFPAVYNFAMSALGYLTVFKSIDTIEGIFAERIYTDSEKTFLNVNDVNIISFSLSFELDYLGILEILKKYNIPFLYKERSENHPLIYGGGPVLSANFEPFKNFFDFIMIGDCEVNIKKVFEILRNNTDKTKTEKLKLLSQIEGIYVPSLNNKVKKITAPLNECVSTPILTEKSFFPNTYIIEIERGCPQNCAFCLTSYINNPVRFNSYEEIISKIDEGLKYTNKIALLGALICSHPQIDDICNYISSKADSCQKKIEVSVSSLRADYVSDSILSMLRKCGQNTATIAVEAGSERLRNIINKKLSDADIFNVIDKMVSFGFKGLKIYGIIGLPTETCEDLDAFVNFVKQIKIKHKQFNIIPSFSTFVPKAHTPFQFAKREDTKTLEKKIEYLKKQFAKIGIKIRVSSAKWDYVQSLLSRGTDELTPYLIDVFNEGANLGNFKNIYKKYEKKGLLKNPDIVALNEIPLDENLPWEGIEYNKNKEFLKKEYKRLMNLNEYRNLI